MLKFESERNALFQALKNMKIIKKKTTGFTVKLKNQDKQHFFMKIDKNVEKTNGNP